MTTMTMMMLDTKILFVCARAFIVRTMRLALSTTTKWVFYIMKIWYQSIIEHVQVFRQALLHFIPEQLKKKKTVHTRFE